MSIFLLLRLSTEALFDSLICSFLKPELIFFRIFVFSTELVILYIVFLISFNYLSAFSLDSLQSLFMSSFISLILYLFFIFIFLSIF